MYTQQDFNGYGSHLPILIALFNKFPIKKVIEFGMGTYSTQFFLKQNLDYLISVEYDKEWFSICKTDLEHHKCIREEPHLFPDHLVEPVDLAFVDGPWGSRVLCVERALPLARFICVHDRRAYATGEDEYLIDAVIPPDWYEFEYWVGWNGTEWLVRPSEPPYKQGRVYPEGCGSLHVTSIICKDENIREDLRKLVSC